MNTMSEVQRRKDFAAKYGTVKRTSGGREFVSYGCPRCKVYSSSVWRAMRAHLQTCERLVVEVLP